MAGDSQQGFTKGRSCLNTFMAASGGVATSVGRGRAMSVIWLDLCKAIDTVPPSTLLSKLEGWIWWVNHPVSEELIGCLHPEGVDEQFSAQMGISDKWWPSGLCIRTSTV